MTCQCCGEPERKVECRRLCQRCYSYLRARGRLDSYDRVYTPTADTVEDAKELASWGLTRDQVCTRLGKKKNTLNQAFRRAGEPWPWA